MALKKRSPSHSIFVVRLAKSSLDWYVDSVNGSDENNGKSKSQAFQTITKLLTVLGSGDKVGAARGSHWREQLTVSGSNISVAAYGSGNRPILDASNVMSDWSKTGGQTYVYQISCTPEWGTTNYLNVWEDGSFLVRAANLAGCDSTPGSYYPSGSSGAITLYVHATDDGDPASNGSVYEYSHRQHGFNSYGYSNCKISGIETRRNLHNDGSLKMGRLSTIVNCLCSSGGYHNLYYGDGSVLVDVIAHNAYYGTTPHSMFVANENAPVSLGILHLNCQAINDTHDTLTTGFYGHRNTSGDFGAVRYINCTTSNIQLSFAFANAGSVLFEECDFTIPASANAIGIRLLSAVVHTLRDCNITLTGGRIVSNEIAGSSVVISGGTWTLDAITNAGMVYGSLAYALDVQNLVLAGGTYSSTLFAFTHADSTIYARNNNYNVNITRCYNIATAANLDSDYNNFYDDSTRNLVEGTDHVTVAAYQAATSQDLHSTIG